MTAFRVIFLFNCNASINASCWLVVSGDAVVKRRLSVCLAKDVHGGLPIMLVCYMPLAAAGASFLRLQERAVQ